MQFLSRQEHNQDPFYFTLLCKEIPQFAIDFVVASLTSLALVRLFYHNFGTDKAGIARLRKESFMLRQVARSFGSW
jgi:hypothetical protein